MKTISYVFIISSIIILVICSPFFKSTAEIDLLTSIRSSMHKTDNEWGNSDYFNTYFLMNYDLVLQKLLKEEQFKEINFATSDNHNINGIWRPVENAKFTMILGAGFYPGRKEGLASFIKLAPENFNLLFFDARGHGKSSGKLFTNLHNYGKDEYKDVIAAIEFAHANSSAPIIVFGLCAGAFHASHALAFLGTEKIIYFNIKGFIFDSGITSIANVAHVPTHYFSDKTIPNLFLKWYTNDTKQEVKQRYLCKISCALVSGFMKCITYCIKPFVAAHDFRTNLQNIMHKIACPIFFIHSKDDAYAPFEHVENLFNNHPNATCWWIDQSEHATHHLKFKHEYYQKLHEFFKEIKKV